MQRWLDRIVSGSVASVLTLATAAAALAAEPGPCRIDDLIVLPPASESTPAPAKPDQKAAPNAPYGLGTALRIKAKNDCAARVRAEYVQGSDRIQLHLGGLPIAGLKPQFKDVADGAELTLYLQRRPWDNDNRKSWDALFAQQRGYTMNLPLSLQVGSSLPVGVRESIVFEVVDTTSVWAAVVLGVAAFVGAFVLLARSPSALRDSLGGRYSLGRSQMAFWGLLVLVSFCAVWWLTRTIEFLPGQTLVLMGLSGVTGIAAAVMSSGKRTPAQRLAEIDTELTPLKALPAPTAAEAMRRNELQAEAQRLQAHSARPPAFWRDICDGGEGIAFHRVQVVLWTIALGVVFVWTVAKQLSMPEFPDTLLLLMGISSGTYLGFKFPEKV